MKELESRNIGYTLFADLCGISRKIMADIVNGEKTDIKLSTIVKICENSGIPIDEIFPSGKSETMEHLKNSYLIINGRRYKIQLLELKKTEKQ